jgi:putative transposase
MTLATNEFIRRFLIHVLPKGFHRIRHYGLLASGNKIDTIARARELLNVPVRQTKAQEATRPGADEPKTLSHPCPCCGGRMSIIETFERGSTPRYRPPPPTAIRIDTS